MDAIEANVSCPNVERGRLFQEHQDPNVGLGLGGLSGRPLAGRTREIVREIYQETGGKLPIIGVGGLFSGQEPFGLIGCGTSAVELLRSLIYKGPAVANSINLELPRLVSEHGFSSVEELRGYYSERASTR